MSDFIASLQAQDRDLIGSPAQPLVSCAKLIDLLETRGLDCPISGDHTALYAATESRGWIYDC